MVTITIKFKDGSVRTTERFSDLLIAEKWIDEEKTRKYWDDSYIIETLDSTAEDQAKEETDKIDRDKIIAAIITRRDQLKVFAQKAKDNTLLPTDVLPALRVLLILNFIELDK